MLCIADVKKKRTSAIKSLNKFIFFPKSHIILAVVE